MLTIIHFFNFIASIPVKGLYLLIQFGGDLWGLLLFALLSTLIFLPVYARISDQEAIKQIKNLLRAHILGIRLFNDHFGVFLGFQAAIAKDLGRYLWLNFKPFALLALPFILVLSQLNGLYGYRPFAKNEAAVLSIKLKPGTPLIAPQVFFPQGFTLEAGPILIPSKNEIVYRLSAQDEGAHQVACQWPEMEFKLEKTFVCGQKTGGLHPYLLNHHPARLLLFPAEQGHRLPDQVLEVALNYPQTLINLGGFRLHWTIVYLICIILFGYLLRGWFDVTF